MLITVYIITILFFITYAVLIIYYRQSWISIPQFSASGLQPSTKLTIIIPARNEEKNIGACIQSILKQQYPGGLFEVIVVNDHSTDATTAIVNSFIEKNIKLISLKDFIDENTINSYKKKAIEIAIQQSTGDLIITTDADCIAPNKWLQTIAAYYEKYTPAFIAGPVTYQSATLQDKPAVRFLKIFESLDFITMQGITGASVYKKFHTMCNGANLAYEKKMFIEVEGFKGIDTIASGDDMLLMHKIYKQYPSRVAYLKSTDAIVLTQPAGTLSAFFHQRIRWASKADKYDDKRIAMVLLLVYLFNAWFIVLAVSGIWNLKIEILLLELLVAKTVVELFFLSVISTFFHRKKLLRWFVVAQPFHILYIIIAGWLGRFGTYKWKERTVK